MTRLIDADALKRNMEFICMGIMAGTENYNAPLTEIDNAPTVLPDNDIFEWCTDCKEYDQEKHCCHRWSSKIREAAEEIKQYKLDELRPHGEWGQCYENYKNGLFYRDCSICGKATMTGDWKFCPYCGADMRGKKE